MQIGQLDGVADLVDLRPEPTDLLVRDIGDLLEDELLDLGLGHPLVDEAGPGVEQDRVPGPDPLASQCRGDAADPLLVGVGHDEQPLGVQGLLDRDDLTDPFVPAGLNDVERLVEPHLTTLAEVGELDRGAHGDPHLAAPGEDVDRGVVVDIDDDPERARRLGEPVHLGPQGDDLLAGVLEGADEAVVLRRQGGHRGLQLQDSTLQVTDPGGMLRPPGPERADLRGERVARGLVRGGRALRLVGGHRGLLRV